MHQWVIRVHATPRPVWLPQCPGVSSSMSRAQSATSTSTRATPSSSPCSGSGAGAGCGSCVGCISCLSDGSCSSSGCLPGYTSVPNGNTVLNVCRGYFVRQGSHVDFCPASTLLSCPLLLKCSCVSRTRALISIAVRFSSLCCIRKCIWLAHTDTSLTCRLQLAFTRTALSLTRPVTVCAPRPLDRAVAVS
jgi:hypothetical protein